MKDRVKQIFNNYTNPNRNSLIPILQDIQDEFGYLSESSVVETGKYLDLPTSKIYGVATFYNQFRFKALGKYHIMVCRGTACHVKGSAEILSALENELKIKSGNTTRDKIFSLEVVACIGACGLAPVISVNGEFHANLSSSDIRGILELYRAKEN
ncbi:MAG: NADH-quinone oxidoreductase subunit NuoE [bacterium]|nr:NADH-quinone oxidoreductase subunit NuoE [bacterium]